MITHYANYDGTATTAKAVRQLAGLFSHTVQDPEDGTLNSAAGVLFPGDYYVIYDDNRPAVLRPTEFQEQKETDA